MIEDSDGIMAEPITVVAYPGQTIRFGAYLKWVRIQNDGPQTLAVYGHDAALIAHVLPGDILPIVFGPRDFNTLRVAAVAGLAATVADIAAGNIPYFHYKFKRGSD